MGKELIVKDENNHNINISCLGIFSIPDLNKKFIIYSLIDEDSDNAASLIAEYLEGENEVPQILGVKKSEKEVVLAYYNEVIAQLGE